MRNQHYFSDPYWTINSNEASLYFFILCAILAIPALPAGVFGWFIGELWIGNNFAKWGLMLLFFGLMYLFIFYIKSTKGLWYTTIVIFLEYLIWDYSSMIYYDKDMLVMQKLINTFIEWGLRIQ